MNVQVHHVIVHTPQQAREIIAEAMLIASESEPDEAQWGHVFDQACALLGQRFTLVNAPQPAPPMDLSRLGLNNRH